MGAKPADLLDFDDFFNSFDDPAVVAPAQLPSAKVDAAQPFVPARTLTEQSVDWASMDAFLDQCLSGDSKCFATQVPAGLPAIPVASELQRMESPSLWGNFGEW